MRLFFCFILFGLCLHTANATDGEFDAAWTHFFPGHNLPPQKNKEQCKKAWFKCKRLEEEARQAGIFIGDNFVKKKLENERQKYHYKDMEQDWFVPFIQDFSTEIDKKEIQSRLGQPENYIYNNIHIGTDREEITWTLGLIAELNTAFNYPLVCLNTTIDKSKLYATVVFTMQEAMWGLDRRINDHSALVLEYCDNDVWKAMMVHYRNKDKKGSRSGGKEHVVEIMDKHSAYKYVLWNPYIDLENHTHVRYFRYATFTFSRENSDHKLKVMEGRKAYLEPYEYSMRGVDGYDNCDTYVARLLELFSGRILEPGSPALHWPEVPLSTAFYKYKVFSPWFTAISLRELITQAQGEGKNEIVLYNQALHPGLVSRYMTLDKQLKSMPSFPVTLYTQYWGNKDGLLDLWNNREKG